jgi:hypothetical protein
VGNIAEATADKGNIQASSTCHLSDIWSTAFSEEVLQITSGTLFQGYFCKHGSIQQVRKSVKHPTDRQSIPKVLEGGKTCTGSPDQDRNNRLGKMSHRMKFKRNFWKSGKYWTVLTHARHTPGVWLGEQHGIACLNRAT